MFKVEIMQKFNSLRTAADQLRQVADGLDRGYNNGFYPAWRLVEINHPASTIQTEIHAEEQKVRDQQETNDVAVSKLAWEESV